MQTGRALEGVKVADFTWVGVGPVTTSYLGDYGAIVVKVESHTHPDIVRAMAPFKGSPPTINTSGFFTHFTSSKYSVTLNLTKPKGRELALELIKWSDVVAENMAPGAMGRLGLDYESARKLKPDIIYCSISTQGQYGPRSSSPGFGQLATALAGISNLSGWPDRGPAPPQGAYTDYITPRFAMAAILAALDYRRRTSKGQYIDTTLVEGGIQFVAPVIMDYVVNGQLPIRKGDCLAPGAPHGAFPCKGSERWIAIGVHTDEEWEVLCQVMGQPPWVSKFATLRARKENEEELERLVGEWTLNYTPEELIDMLQAAGVPANPVESTRDLFDDSQIKHRGHFRQLEHSVMGSYVHDSRAFRLSKTPDNQFAAPAIGEHNDYVLREILGLSDDEVAELYIDGVLTTDADLPKIW